MTTPVSQMTAWQGGKCRVPMWMGGSPSGHCDNIAFGPQYPREYLAELNVRYLLDRPAYCFGPCCPNHGGPAEGAAIIFQDGYTEQGRPMYCAVMPDFINLQESPAGFSGDARRAVANLKTALAAAAGAA
ncbi:hypothetical protein VW35_01005 [Devosia soli]|uniref:Uncharacterized protein n=1 Tax=Devosia soli TaxID=361041 RepID=A0A0F5LEN2_9HYPH|nr:hypothetical protein VW35_01005 [Devosia soli]